MTNERRKFVCKVIGNTVLTLFDVGTDCLNLGTYWNAGTVSIFWASLTFVILPLPFSLGQLFLGCWQWRYGDEESYIEKNDYLNLMETIVESIPQLIISVIFMSICGGKLGIAQYATVAVSSIAIAARLFDQEVDTTIRTFVMCSKYAVMYICKLLYVTARVFALAYFCFFLGWWILVIFGLRYIAWIVANMCIRNSWREYLFSLFVHTLAMGAVLQGTLALILPLYTICENMILVVAAYGYSQSDNYINHTGTYAGVEVVGSGKNTTVSSTYELFFGKRIEEVYPGFCLYSYPIALHGALNLVTAVLIITCFVLQYRKKHDPLANQESLTKQQD